MYTGRIYSEISEIQANYRQRPRYIQSSRRSYPGCIQDLSRVLDVDYLHDNYKY